ncbi:MAG: HD-GYP domain-containing protein [Motiliproteus sp.]
MIKKTSVSDLKVGIYIHDLNCGWMDHPFARSRFKINSKKTLEKIQSLNIKAVYIDTNKGLDLPGAPSREDANRDQLAVVERLAQKKAAPKPRQKTFQDELSNGVEVLRKANQLVTEMMHDVGAGKKLELHQPSHIVERMTQSLIRNPDVLPALTQIRNADHYTFQHSVSTCTLMVAFCQYLGVPPDKITSIGVGTLLHDIGKVKIPDKILNKPGRLSDDEFNVMRSHVVHSKLILAQIPGVDDVTVAIAAEHHERYDGSGYPEGLKGDQMNYYSQIASIIDVYDAISSDRCYQKGLPPTESLRRLYEWSEAQFDRELVQQFIRFVGVYPPGSIVELESRYLALVLSKTDSPLEPLVRVVFDTSKEQLVQPRDIDLSTVTVDDKITHYAQVGNWGLSRQKLLELML